MLATTESDEATRKRPFEFLSSLFKRRRDHDDIDAHGKPPEINFQECDFLPNEWQEGSSRQPNITTDDPDSTTNSPAIRSPFSPAASCISMTSTPSPLRSFSQASHQPPLSPGPGFVSPTCLDGRTTSPAPVDRSTGVLSSCASPIIVHHTPIRSRDIGIDMEAIRLSRQDNPYLQKVAGSQPHLADTDDNESADLGEEEDTTYLVSQGREVQQDALSIEEVHEHLIRSPPPTSIPKGLPGKTFFVFDSELEEIYEGSKTLPAKIRGQSLNPLLTKGHEDVLDTHLRQILDTQRKLSIPKEPTTMNSVSVPGSPAKTTAQSIHFHCKKAPRQRTFSEEVSSIVGNCPDDGAHSSKPYLGEGNLAPVHPPGKKTAPNTKVILTRPLLANTPAAYHTSASSSVGNILRPITKSSKFQRSSSLKGVVLSQRMTTGSSSSLTLPIRHPHQPATTPHHFT